MTMIPAPSGLTAHYRPGMDQPVIAFSETGKAMILDSTAGRLIPADTYRNFQGVIDDHSRYLSVLPGGGWLWRYPSGNELPVLGWGLTSDGNLVPMAPDGTGLVDDFMGEKGYVYHPDHPWPEDTEPGPVTVPLGAWLTAQTHRDDAVGKLARDLLADDGCGQCADRAAQVPVWTLPDVVRDIERHGGDSAAWGALELACAEWTGR